mmetsp:Transcript_39587/g.119625  ORF Transcript_39587/g.119625 Transcript_39587/m.119625 type:complete len:265 (-) Transcript_39587:1465-2259(-)
MGRSPYALARSRPPVSPCVPLAREGPYSLRSLLSVSLLVARARLPALSRASRCAAAARRFLPRRLPPPHVARVASVAFCSISLPRGAARAFLFPSSLAPVAPPPPPRACSSVAVPRRLQLGRRGARALFLLLPLRCHPAPHLPSHCNVASHCAYGCRLSCRVRGWRRARCWFSRARASVLSGLLAAARWPVRPLSLVRVLWFSAACGVGVWARFDSIFARTHKRVGRYLMASSGRPHLGHQRVCRGPGRTRESSCRHNKKRKGN